MGQRLSGHSKGRTKKGRRGFDSVADYALVLHSLVGGSGNHRKSIQRDHRVLLSFLSPTCGLCNSLKGTLEDIQEQEKLDIVRIDSSKVDAWGPELIRYNIETVPCFVLLDNTGNAVGKTVAFANTKVVEKALESLIGRK